MCTRYAAPSRHAVVATNSRYSRSRVAGSARSPRAQPRSLDSEYGPCGDACLSRNHHTVPSRPASATRRERPAFWAAANSSGGMVAGAARGGGGRRGRPPVAAATAVIGGGARRRQGIRRHSGGQVEAVAVGPTPRLGVAAVAVASHPHRHPAWATGCAPAGQATTDAPAPCPATRSGGHGTGSVCGGGWRSRERERERVRRRGGAARPPERGRAPSSSLPSLTEWRPFEVDGIGGGRVDSFWGEKGIGGDCGLNCAPPRSSATVEARVVVRGWVGVSGWDGWCAPLALLPAPKFGSASEL